MKILYIENATTGHRVTHLLAFEALPHENYLMIPEFPAQSTMHWIPYQNQFIEHRCFKTYLQFIKQIVEVVREYQIDLVHFLDTDSIYRYFGIGLGWIPCPVLLTCHGLKTSRLHDIAIRRLYSRAEYGVIHTRHLAQRLQSLGISNYVHIENPMLEPMSQLTVSQAREHFGIAQDAFTIGALGATAAYKRMDILVEALNQVTEPCTLLVAGKADVYDEAYIRSHMTNEKVSLCLHLRWLEGSEFVDAVQASDVLAFPYDKGFDASSSPMVSAVMHGKLAVSSDHGSLGDVMREYQLGPTVPAEDVSALAQAIDCLARGEFSFSQQAQAFRKELDVAVFQEKYQKIYQSIQQDGLKQKHH